MVKYVAEECFQELWWYLTYPESKTRSTNPNDYPLLECKFKDRPRQNYEIKLKDMILAAKSSEDKENNIEFEVPSVPVCDISPSND